MTDIDMHEQMVTDTIEYKGKKVKFSLKKYVGDESKKDVNLWYIEAAIEGFKKPFNSKFISSVFARDRYEAAKELHSPQEYLDALFLDADKIMNTTCELLAADLDSVSIIWYCDGKVQVEEDQNLVQMIKNLIDHLDQDVSKLVLTNTGYL